MGKHIEGGGVGAGVGKLLQWSKQKGIDSKWFQGRGDKKPMDSGYVLKVEWRDLLMG